jgi:hypothetical protein
LRIHLPLDLFDLAVKAPVEIGIGLRGMIVITEIC